MPDLENPDDDSGGDSDFEAELAAITAGSHKTKPKPQKPKVVPQSDLDKMVAESLRDIGWYSTNCKNVPNCFEHFQLFFFY